MRYIDTVDKESAVQKPSSKRRIAYVSGTLEGGIQIKGTGLIVDRFWGRAEMNAIVKEQLVNDLDIHNRRILLMKCNYNFDY